MTRPFGRLLNQTITYWEPDSTDVYGNTSWDAGEEISARWEEKAEGILDANGDNVMSRAVVYVAGTQSVEIGGRMYKGIKSELTAAQIPDPDKVPNSYRIIMVQESPDLRNRRSLKKVWLK